VYSKIIFEEAVLNAMEEKKTTKNYINAFGDNKSQNNKNKFDKKSLGKVNINNLLLRI